MQNNFLTDEEVTEIQFYRQIMRIPWNEHENNEEVMMKMLIRKIIILQIKK